MPLTTPEAPVDVTAAFPEFVGQARSTVRLHPRSGHPGPGDSSLGGQQVLWCPGLHDDGCWPLPIVRWRDASSVTGSLPDAPAVDPGAAEVDEEYVPKPCVLSPERVSTCADGWELDDDLRDRVVAWSQERGWHYFLHLGAAPGTAEGGRPDWIQDPEYPACEALCRRANKQIDWCRCPGA
jgi:hypothetical protein